MGELRETNQKIRVFRSFRAIRVKPFAKPGICQSTLRSHTIHGLLKKGFSEQFFGDYPVSTSFEGINVAARHISESTSSFLEKTIQCGLFGH